MKTTANQIQAAKTTIMNVLRIEREATELSLLTTCELAGLNVWRANDAIAELVADGVVVETQIDGSIAGFGMIDAIRLAA